VNSNGDISNYFPDFFVKTTDGKTFVIETKGQEDLDVPLKMARLKQWCTDINEQPRSSCFDFIFVDDESFAKYQPKSFADLVKGFREYKD
jgi:type III restriction enzyme